MAEEVRIIVRAEDSFSGVLGNFGNIITGIRSAVSLAADVFRTFTEFAGQGLDAVASYERLSLSLETLAAREAIATGQAENMADALKMTAGESQVLLDWMQQLAIKSPFTLEGVANAFRLAEAYGFTADEAQRLVQAMIDFAAGTGASEGVMNQIALALGQIQAKGKLAGQEVLQLVNAGLPVTQILAEAFGTTTAEITKMQSEGLIPAQQAIEAITEYLETNFAGAAERQAESWAGLQGTFEDLKQMGLREFFGDLFLALQPLAIELSNFLQGPGLAMLGTLGDSLGAIATTAFEKFAGFSESPFVEWLNGIIENSTVITETFKTVESSLKGNTKSSWSIELGTAVDPDLFIANLKAEIEIAIKDKMKDTDWEPLVNSLFDSFGDADYAGAISQGIVDSMKNIDWTQAGVDFGKSIRSLFENEMGEINWLGLITEPIVGAFEFLVGWFAGFWKLKVSSSLEEAGEQWGSFFKGLGPEIRDGFIAGLGSFADWGTRIWNDFIDDAKEIFGISSPSTVFFDIGRDIVQGLINGLDSILGPLLAKAKDVASKLIEPLSPVLDALGIDLGFSSGSHGTSGTVNFGGGTSTNNSSQTVNNYYYGPVYFQGAGEPGAYYDCPSPNPLMTAGSGIIGNHTVGR